MSDHKINHSKNWQHGVYSHFPAGDLIRDDEKLKQYADDLVRYLQGQINKFTIPIFYRGTPFQEAVWKVLCDIPYGQTRSYFDIAHQIQKPVAVRAVGTHRYESDPDNSSLSPRYWQKRIADRLSWRNWDENKTFGT